MVGDITYACGADEKTQTNLSDLSTKKTRPTDRISTVGGGKNRYVHSIGKRQASKPLPPPPPPPYPSSQGTYRTYTTHQTTRQAKRANFQSAEFPLAFYSPPSSNDRQRLLQSIQMRNSRCNPWLAGGCLTQPTDARILPGWLKASAQTCLSEFVEIKICLGSGHG